MDYKIREINKGLPSELDLVTQRCMATVLETIPEFNGNADTARASLSNFTHGQMSQMIAKDFADPTKRIMVAEAADGTLVGQALFSVKVDNEGVKYGFCFSRYIAPEFRKKGIASAFLKDALDWFKQNEAKYVIAQTHLTNIKLQNLFAKFGFEKSGPLDGSAWQYILLKKLL